MSPFGSSPVGLVVTDILRVGQRDNQAEKDPKKVPVYKNCGRVLGYVEFPVHLVLWCNW